MDAAGRRVDRRTAMTGRPAAETPLWPTSVADLSTCLVIGVGNPFRSDDAAGLLVARQLKPLLPEAVAVGEQSGEGTTLMASWQGFNHVILVDAVCSGAVPGTVHRFDASNAPLPALLFGRYSSHSFGVYEAVEMARQLDQLPLHLVLFGIEGESFDNRVGISAPVGRAIEIVIENVLGELDALLQST